MMVVVCAWTISPSTDADREAVRGVSPLAADLWLNCFDVVTVPAALCAVPGEAELGDGEASDVLRAFLDDNPWEGMGSVTRDGWLLLAYDELNLVFGQRRGAVGLGTAVHFTRTASTARFEPQSLSGHRLVAAGGLKAETVYRVTTDGPVLSLTWDAGQDGGRARIPHRRVAQIRVSESDTQVHILVLSEANPALPPAASGWIAGTGFSVTDAVTLRQPLGDRLLYDDHIPARPLQVSDSKTR